jgi:hypothetical protein
LRPTFDTGSLRPLAGYCGRFEIQGEKEEEEEQEEAEEAEEEGRQKAMQKGQKQEEVQETKAVRLQQEEGRLQARAVTVPCSRH